MVSFSDNGQIEILKVIGGYSKALDLLDDYDHKTLKKIKSIEEKGANFLYLIVKNHVFTDGNIYIDNCNFLVTKT